MLVVLEVLIVLLCFSKFLFQITLIDYGDGPEGAKQLPLKIFANDTFTSIGVCSEKGIVFGTSVSDTAYIFRAAKRNAPSEVARAIQDDFEEPKLLHVLQVGSGPDHIVANPDCTILGVANEGSGEYDDDIGLVNPEGSISLIRDFEDAAKTPSVETISLNLWTDEELLEKGVHLPVSKNALEYWDLYSKDAEDINFTAARESYTTASVLEPEWMAWTPDGSRLLVSLQDNNAILIVDPETNSVKDIFRYE
jgi:DNA-binding beta-propeller fold protein YncE